MRPALFLDRDGVVNVDHGYVHRAEDFHWMPGIFDLAQTATRFGLAVIIVTNQAGIARGYYTEKQFLELSDWMAGRFASVGAPLTGVYFCPEHPEGLPPYNRPSERRKPAPGMLLDAAREHRIDLGRSALIGDQLSDLAAGRAAGLSRVALFGNETARTHAPDEMFLADHAASCAWLTDFYADSPLRLNAATPTSSRP